jgi:hypothetical protein
MMTEQHQPLFLKQQYFLTDNRELLGSNPGRAAGYPD